jgi:Mo-dependent nitrogenase C-terminus
MTTITHDHHHHDHAPFVPRERPKVDPLAPLRRWVDGIEIRDRVLAHRLCRLIPCQCAFERDIHLFGKMIHIPALCKLNPLYDEVVMLRFRALSFLADDCGEDISAYC